jgi:putative transcriptional regulator
MTFSFNLLWKKLIDRGMTKEELRKALSLSPTTIAKMGKGENVSLEVIGKLCKYFECQPGDLLEYIPDNIENNPEEQQ